MAKCRPNKSLCGMKDGLFNPFFTGNYANPYSYSGGDTPGETPTEGFTFDTTGMINGSGQAVIIVTGDSMGSGTTSIRPWQSGFTPQHPDPIAGAVYEFVYADGVVEVTEEVTGSLQTPDIYPANTQSQWPQFGNDFYTQTGIKPIILRSAIGGAEFLQNGIGDLNQWQTDDIVYQGTTYTPGENYGFLMTAWEKCKTDAGVTKPLMIIVHCGINDAAASRPLGAIRLAIIQHINNLITDFGADVPIRVIGVGSSGGISANTRIIAVRQMIEDTVRNEFSDMVQFSVSTYDYFDLGHYGTFPTDDGVHFTQAGNNAIGTDMVNYELTPFFNENIKNSVFPNFTSLSSSGVTLNFNCRVNFKLATTATVYWAVYPYAEANHTTGEIQAGTDAVALGSKVTNCNTDETVDITGLANNTRYRVQMYAVIDTVESDVYRTITFRTRSSGNDPITDSLLAKLPGLDAEWTTKYTEWFERLLDYDIEAGLDYIYCTKHNSSGDILKVIKGPADPVNLGSNPAFVAGSGLRTTAHTGTDRLNLQINDFDLPNYLSNDGFYAINVWEDTNVIDSGTYRAMFGNTQSTNRQTRFGVTYNSASSKFITFGISAGSATIDFPLEASTIEVNKLHIVSKGVTESTTLDAELMIDSDTRFVAASPAVDVANTVDWYMFAQNNNGAISARSSNGINLLIVGGLSLINRDFLTLACKSLGIGV